MTPLPSSQKRDPRQVSVDGWTEAARTLVRRRTIALIETDAHFRTLKPRAQRLVTILLAFHMPDTGYTKLRTLNDVLTMRCRCSVSTLKRARHDLIEAGFIVGYKPGGGNPGRGTGGRAGDYMVARTPEEAAEARALRIARAQEVAEIERERELDPTSTREPVLPYWPAFPEREPLGMPQLRETRGRPSKAAQEARAQGNKEKQPDAHDAPQPAPAEVPDDVVALTDEERAKVTAHAREEARALAASLRNGAAQEATVRRRKAGHTDEGRAAAEAELARARQQHAS